MEFNMNINFKFKPINLKTLIKITQFIASICTIAMFFRK